MDERVWVGSLERMPAGGVGIQSVESYLTSAMTAQRIVIDDLAAALREADFLRLFTHSPLARIERLVGPWRAGLGRTDPAWPRVTTRCGDQWSAELLDDYPVCPLPLTADYEEIAAALVAQPVCLDGVSVSVQIADGELRQMWEDLLSTVGAELVALPDSASVWLLDESSRWELPTSEPHCVHLTTAPWLEPTSARSIAFSTSDSPWSVMQSISRWLKRGDREAD